MTDRERKLTNHLAVRLMNAVNRGSRVVVANGAGTR
jgi:hypothetical protein